MKNKYQKDLSFLYKKLKNLHPRFKESKYQKSLGNYYQRIMSKLSEKEVDKNIFVAEIMKFFVLIGDSHTGFQQLPITLKFKSVPLRVKNYVGKYHIIQVKINRRDAVSKAIREVNSIPIKKIESRVKMFLPHENDVV